MLVLEVDRDHEERWEGSGPRAFAQDSSMQVRAFEHEPLHRMKQNTVGTIRLPHASCRRPSMLRSLLKRHHDAPATSHAQMYVTTASASKQARRAGREFCP